MERSEGTGESVLSPQSWITLSQRVTGPEHQGLRRVNSLAGGHCWRPGSSALKARQSSLLCGQREHFLEGASQYVFQPVLRDQSIMLLPP